jgi:hypothetical protein
VPAKYAANLKCKAKTHDAPTADSVILVFLPWHVGAAEVVIELDNILRTHLDHPTNVYQKRRHIFSLLQSGDFLALPATYR